MREKRELLLRERDALTPAHGGVLALQVPGHEDALAGHRRLLTDTGHPSAQAAAETLRVPECRRVDGQEEVSHTARLVVRLGVEMAQLMVQGHAGEKGAEDLDHHVE